MRVLRDKSGKMEAQLALRKLVPTRGHGPAIWLVSASHLGETNYYAALQKHLDAQKLVLYEGVRERTSHEPARRKGAKPPWDRQAVAEMSPLQVNMAKALGLVFQLQAMDYNRDNFQNSDLSVTQLRELLSKAPPTSDDNAAGKQFDNLMQAMSGDSLLAGVLNFIFKVIGSDPKVQAMAKLALIETFDQLQGDFGKFQGLPPGFKELLRVIIEERNKQVVLDVKAAAKKLSKKDSIAIFYGGGHMPDMEKRIKSELSYRAADEIWLTAFSVNPRAVGLSDQDTAMVRSLIEWQMGLMK
jgi:hypothetical protein